LDKKSDQHPIRLNHKTSLLAKWQLNKKTSHKPVKIGKPAVQDLNRFENFI
jgi:hypothetical protein